MKDFNKKYFIYIFIFLTFFTTIYFLKKDSNSNQNNINTIVFNYPKENISFAWEEVFLNPSLKERFDKEFLNTWYNLYQFFLYVKRIPIYIPYIEEKLKENNLDNDYKYLVIAESALRNDITSSVWAAWIWQFMPETAKQYWLIVNQYIDERYNFEKSTSRAIEYLKYLENIFPKNPSLVLASYNRWENAIKRALKDQNVNSFYDLYLNEETSRYVFKILAIKYVIKDYESKKEYIDNLIWWLYEKPKIKKINIKNEIKDLKSWSIQNNINYYRLKELNKWILSDYLPKWNWDIEIDEK